MRNYSKSFIIWLLFGVIIAVFVIGFGTPGSDKLSCGETTKIGEVEDTELKETDFKYAFRLLLREQAPATMKAWVLDMILRREILANEAKRMGFRTAVKPQDASEDPDVVKMITDRKILVLGYERDLFAMGGWPRVRKADGSFEPAESFNYDHFKKWSMWQMGLQINDFMRQQQKELLAKEMADTIMSGVQISETEVRAAFNERNHKLNLYVAKFPADKFRTEVSATPADIEQILKDKDEVERLKTKHTLEYGDEKDLPEARYIHQIFVPFPEDAGATEKTQTKTDLRNLSRGATAENFTEIAKKAAQGDEKVKKEAPVSTKSGRLGWKTVEELKEKGYGEDFVKSVFELKNGVISQPMESEKGWHVVLVDGRRKGTWSFEEAKKFLAAERVLEKKALKAAEKAAKEKLANLKAGKNPESVFFGEAISEEKKDETVDASDAAKATDVKDKKEQKDDPLNITAAPPNFEVNTVSVTRVSEHIQGLEAIQGLVPKAWSLTEEKSTFDELVTLQRGGETRAFVVIHRKSEEKPDLKAFEDQKDFLIASQLRIKQVDTLNRWIRERCEKLVKEGKIWMDKQFTKITYTPEGQTGPDAKPVTVQYKYCSQLPHHADPRLQNMAGGL